MGSVFKNASKLISFIGNTDSDFRWKYISKKIIE